MTFLPVVGRELRVASRKKATYFARLGAAVTSICVGAFFAFSIGGYSSPQQLLGKWIFATLAVVAFIYCVGSGVLATSDCLSVEERDGTLGLLFLTDLKGYDVVFGKLVANSLNAFYGMLAIFPILAVPILMGGVTAKEFTRVMLVCVSLMFYSLSAGLFCSAICRDERKAATLTAVLLVVMCAGTPLAGAYYTERDHANSFYTGFLMPSPILNCWLAFDVFGMGKNTEFW